MTDGSVTTVLAVPTGLTPSQRNRFICRQAERIVEETLRSAGYDVINLNDLGDNCPYMDLLATRDGDRVLVQVKGTTTVGQKFGAPPGRARSLAAVATALGCRSVYAFVWMAREGGSHDVRFATAAEVVVLTEDAIENATSKLRYHLNLGDIVEATPGSPPILASTFDRGPTAP